jgi:hypothetical protein
VPHCLVEKQAIQPHGHPALLSAHDTMLMITMPGVAESFKTDIDEMTHGTKFELVNWLYTENAMFTNKDLNTRIVKPDNRWNSHLVSYDTLTSRAKPSSNG